ncbi:hypothetical protein H8J16_29080 [Klebsiella pneumoniae]|nr:hypothetical protein [Klebsiella pneumoniae]
MKRPHFLAGQAHRIANHGPPIDHSIALQWPTSKKQKAAGTHADGFL